MAIVISLGSIDKARTLATLQPLSIGWRLSRGKLSCFHTLLTGEDATKSSPQFPQLLNLQCRFFLVPGSRLLVGISHFK